MPNQMSDVKQKPLWTIEALWEFGVGLLHKSTKRQDGDIGLRCSDTERIMPFYPPHSLTSPKRPVVLSGDALRANRQLEGML